MSTTHRTAGGALLLGLVGSAILARTGHAAMSAPLLVGLGWGLANLYLLARLIRHLRPDQPTRPVAVALDVLLKGPIMYGVACVLLLGRTGPEIVGAAIGMGLVLFTILLQALGALVTKSEASRGPVRHIPIRHMGRA